MDKKCSERIDSHFESRMEALQTLVKLYETDPDASDNDYGTLHEYGLSFDYVSSDYEDQTEGYFRYQLSWGGPSDEFRFFVNDKMKPYRIEYWFLDWFDGASINLCRKDFDFMFDFFVGYFVESGTAEYIMEKELSNV